MNPLRRWRPAVRIARRDLRRHPGRTALTVLLVLVPVLVATAVTAYAHNLLSGEHEARRVMGGADGLIQVTPWAQARVHYSSSTIDARPARPGVATRPVTDVDLAVLLPDGARATPAPRNRVLPLPTGGRAYARVLDATDPMTAGLYPGIDGEAPDASDEAAVARGLAEVFGLLDGDDLRPDATLTLPDGQVLRVVGLVRPDENDGITSRTSIVLPLSSPLAPRQPPHRWLVDLPDESPPAVRTLVRDLAADGVALMPRDAVLHPAAWGDSGAVEPLDLIALLAGVLVLLVGLIEVVLVVGAAFAVGARRQVRDLGLVAATGGASTDVRRTLLAQGLVVGVVGSALGAMLGAVAFRVSVPAYEAVQHQTLWTRDLPLLPIVGIVLLGTATSVVAALVPAWSIGRLTPLQALSGRFPVQTGEARTHRAAFGLIGAGIVGLAMGGIWISRSGGRAGAVSAGSVLAGIGFVLLVAGVCWGAPYTVRRVAGLGRHLPLSGRYSFRDAARHRFRSAAASLALAITMASAVLVGFAVESSTAEERRDWGLPPDRVLVPDVVQGVDQAVLRRVVTDVFGPTAGLARIERLRSDRSDLSVIRHPFWDVGQVDEDTLRALVDPVDLDRALDAWRSGGVVVADLDADPHRTERVVVGAGAGDRVALPATVVRPVGADAMQMLWVSASTARAHGWRPAEATFVVDAGHVVDEDDLVRLTAYGIDGYSTGPDQVRTRIWSWLGIGAAGLLATVIAGIAVALAAAEGRADQATLAAVGAGPGRRRRMGAAHGLLLGVVGGLLGLVIGMPAGLSFGQLDGAAGTGVPWLHLLAVAFVAPIVAAAAGWVVTPGRLSLARRSD